MFPRRRIAWILLASYEEVRWIVKGIPNTKCYSFMLGIWGTWWNESSGFQSSGLVCEWVCMLMNLKIILINFYLQCSRAFLSQSSKLPHSFYEPVQKVQELHSQVDHSKGSSPDHQCSGSYFSHCCDKNSWRYGLFLLTVWEYSPLNQGGHGSWTEVAGFILVKKQREMPAQLDFSFLFSPIHIQSEKSSYHGLDYFLDIWTLNWLWKTDSNVEPSLCSAFVEDTIRAKTGQSTSAFK